MHPTWAGDLFHPRYYTCFDAVIAKFAIQRDKHRGPDIVLILHRVFSYELCMSTDLLSKYLLSVSPFLRVNQGVLSHQNS